jgi:tetratricopeptide (TPR) repeat protein
MTRILPVAFQQTALSLLLIGPLLAQAIPEDQRLCIGLPGVTPDQRIAGCTAVLESPDPPRNVDVAYVFRALGYEQKRQFDRAIDDIDQFIRLHPTDPGARALRCRVRTLNVQMDAALVDCNEALRLRPNDAEAQSSRGFVYLNMGQFDSAIGDFSAVLQIQPKNAGALYGRGTAKLGSGDSAGGTADIAAAEALAPTISDLPLLKGVPAPTK